MGSATLADQPDSEAGAVHLLLIADTKLGKSSYVAQAAKAGFSVFYVDSDNGKSAINFQLKDDLAARQRVVYLPTSKPAKFIEGLFEASREFSWNLDLDSEYVAMTAKPEHRIFTVNIPLWLSAKHCLLSIDSWTSIAADCMDIGANKARVKLTEMGNDAQKVYGDALRRADLILNCIQHAPFHVIVQAHGTTFEKYEKPEGKTMKEMKQADFRLIDTIDVPISTSRPHGRQMGKYFNHIAWLDYDPSSPLMPKVMIDFRRSPLRISGGPPNCFKLASEYGFEHYASGVGTEFPEGTFEIRPASELQPASQTSLAAAGPQEVKPLPGLAGLNLQRN